MAHSKFNVIDHEKRKKGIGGSDVGAILGFSKYKTRYDIWLEKTSEGIIIGEDNPKMKAGRHLEPIIVDMYVEETGAKILKKNPFVVDKKHDFLIGNLDGISKREGKKRVLECKATFDYAFKHWHSDIPLTYYTQGQHYASIANLEFIDFAILKNGWDLEIIKKPRDDEFIALMNEKLIDFWQNYVIPKIPPPPMTLEEIKQFYPSETTNQTIEADIITASNFNKYIELRKNFAKLESEFKEKLEDYEFELKNYIGENAGLKIDGAVVVNWNKNKDSIKFDFGALQKNYPRIYKKYTSSQPGARPFKIANHLLKED